MRTVARNQRARFDYEIQETLEAGIVLTGQEVKSARAGNINLSGAYVSFLTGKPVLKQAKIQPYRYASGLEGYDPARDRPLLLRAQECTRLRKLTEEKGVTLLPLEVRSGRTVKVLLGLGRGRKKLDKRRRIREREVERKLRRGEEI